MVITCQDEVRPPMGDEAVNTITAKKQHLSLRTMLLFYVMFVMAFIVIGSIVQLARLAF